MNKHILIIDDEIDIVNFMANFLKRFKISIIKATSGEEGLKAYDKDKVGLVFLDIQMPGIDGISVLRKIRKINPQAKVIMITAKTDAGSRAKAKRLGAFDYISKPLDLGELKDKIEKCIL